jgi:uncharacterized protein (DUF1800 family)
MALRVPSTQTRHLLNRFSYGVTPALVRQAESHGGARRWLEWQMTPTRISDPYAREMWSWFPDLARTPAELWQANRTGGLARMDVTFDFVRWTLLRRTYSQRQLHEVMAELWSHLLYIPAADVKAWPHRVGYDRTIRAHALGRFERLLLAATTHPAMTSYLDNAKSTKDDLNENLGRELLELHTVGRTSGYTEHHVLDSARMLTGYRVDMDDSRISFYSPDDHVTGRVDVLGFSSANPDPDGRTATAAYIRYLARHPATARNIARRLCVRFVRDDPSTGIVNAVAKAYSRSGTDIRAALRALVDHPEFAESVGAKVRTPTEDACATYRALGVRATRPTRDSHFANGLIWHSTSMGESPFDWPRPDGPPDVASAWTSSGRMLNSWLFHRSLGGRSPSGGAVHRTPSSWLPALPARLDRVVDHMSRQLLSRPASTALCTAASTCLGIPKGRVIRRFDDLRSWRITLLVSTILNTPQHMTR